MTSTIENKVVADAHQALARSFDLQIRAEVGAQFVSRLRKMLRSAYVLYPSPLAELSVALVNDQRMSELHLKYLNITGPTDVLTFPLEVDELDRAIAGEVIICVPEAKRASRRHGVTVENELLLYAIHGMLHLGGLDDRTASQYKRMHRIEDDILARLGVGPVFARNSRAIAQARGER